MTMLTIGDVLDRYIFPFRDPVYAEDVERWVRVGHAKSRPLPSVEVDGQLLFDRNDLEQWIDDVTAIAIGNGYLSHTEHRLYEPAECQPTHHAPGSYEKVEVLRQRYELGQHMHHSDDEAVLATVQRRPRI